MKQRPLYAATVNTSRFSSSRTCATPAGCLHQNLLDTVKHQLVLFKQNTPDTVKHQLVLFKQNIPDSVKHQLLISCLFLFFTLLLSLCKKTALHANLALFCTEPLNLGKYSCVHFSCHKQSFAPFLSNSTSDQKENILTPNLLIIPISSNQNKLFFQ